MTNAVNLASAAGTGFAFRNRIINGDMRIDQRNNGATVTTASGTTNFGVDRLRVIYDATSRFTYARSTVAPSGFTNSTLVTSSGSNTASAGQAFLISQEIEGYNVADLNWGTSSALPVTLSFWVRSSLTGTFAGSIENATNARSYVYTYTISSANTWEYKTVTIPGDTTGTWATDNSIGMKVRFDIGSGSNFVGTANAWNTGDRITASGAVNLLGTNGATFYLTGVQLEVGSVATPFERRPYGLELALCQRYYVTGTSPGSLNPTPNTVNISIPISFPVTMRAGPSSYSGVGMTITFTNSTGMTFYQNVAGSSWGGNATYIASAEL